MRRSVHCCHILTIPCLLQNFLTLDTPVPEGEGEGEGEVGWANAEAVVLGVQTALRELWDQHQALIKASMARIFRTGVCVCVCTCVSVCGVSV